MDFEWHNVIGVSGAVCLLATYLLLQVNWMSAKSLRYSILNGVGSAMILTSLMQQFNMSAFVVETCWLVISIIGAVVTIRDRWTVTQNDSVDS